MCTRLYSLKLGETVPTDICMPSAAWCWGQSTATQRSTMDQIHQQTSQGVTNNHGDRPSGPQGAPRDAPESRARSRACSHWLLTQRLLAAPGGYQVAYCVNACCRGGDVGARGTFLCCDGCPRLDSVSWGWQELTLSVAVAIFALDSGRGSAYPHTRCT